LGPSEPKAASFPEPKAASFPKPAAAGSSGTEAAGPSEVARRAASELAALHAALAALEAHLGEAGAARGVGAVETLQSLDHARQTAGGMAVFLRRWAATLPDGPPASTDALVAGLALRDLGERLRGAVPAADRGGEVDLF
jgi:hypothetical protein